MYPGKKTITVASFMAFIVLGGTIAKNSASRPPRNLKVLPKDISDAKLDSIMGSYNKALGVNCDFCHAKPNSLIFGAKDSLDFASDKNTMKENAREMMHLTIDINEKYFYFNKEIKPVYLNTVTCITCHRGEPMPNEGH